MAEWILLILVVVFLVEWRLKPRFDYVIDTNRDEKWVILWYGNNYRNYIKLFKV